MDRELIIVSMAQEILCLQAENNKLQDIINGKNKTCRNCKYYVEKCAGTGFCSVTHIKVKAFYKCTKRVYENGRT